MRTSEDAITRALCLAAVVTRANAEDLVGLDEPVPLFAELTGVEPKDAPLRIDQWLSREGLTAGLSGHERVLLNMAVGHWPKQDLLNAFWRREALMAILWSLRIVDPMPPSDVQLELGDLLRSVGLLKETRQFRKVASLRSAEEVRKMRDQAELWLWRVRTTQLQNSPDSFNDSRISKEQLAVIIAQAAEAGEQKGMFRCIEGDFPAFGKPFRGLSEDEWSLMHSICRERLYGLNWLCDMHGVEWDYVRTGT